MKDNKKPKKTSCRIHQPQSHSSLETAPLGSGSLHAWHTRLLSPPSRVRMSNSSFPQLVPWISSSSTRSEGLGLRGSWITASSTPPWSECRPQGEHVADLPCPPPGTTTEHSLDALVLQAGSEQNLELTHICEKSSYIWGKDVINRKSFPRLGRLRRQKDRKEAKIRSKWG